MADGIATGIEKSIYSLVQKGLLTIENAAKELNISVEEFTERFKNEEI